MDIYGNSQLFINWVNDIYNTKDEKLCPYKIVVAELLHRFERYNITTITRINNKYANAMESASSLAPIEIVYDHTILKIKHLAQPSYMENDSDIEICCIS